MILVDTSIWIDHLRSGNEDLITLLRSSKVSMHPLVIGEIACGNLRRRSEVLSLLKSLPQSKVAHDDEVLLFIEQRQLMGKGIGYVDMHLLAAALLNNTRLWTGDKRLNALSVTLNINYSPS